jgi:hypothetical protein
MINYGLLRFFFSQIVKKNVQRTEISAALWPSGPLGTANLVRLVLLNGIKLQYADNISKQGNINIILWGSK